MSTHSAIPDTDAAAMPEIACGATIANAMAALARGPLDQVDMRILVCHALRLTRIQLITQSERRLTADEAMRINALLHRRLRGEPVAYLVGVREFYGLPLQVTPDVLIPRPETELLVDLALAHLPAHQPHARVLDLGTGSGAIAVAIAHARPDLFVTAVDVSAAALAVARANVSQHVNRDDSGDENGTENGTENRAVNRHATACPVTLLQGDWYAALDGAPGNGRGEQGFHLIVSNPPYIADRDPHLSIGDLRFEPPNALTDGFDGLSALRTIVRGAPYHLQPGGWLLMEHGYDQAESVRTLLAENGFTDVESWRDLAGIERVTGGRR